MKIRVHDIRLFQGFNQLIYLVTTYVKLGYLSHSRDKATGCVVLYSNQDNTKTFLFNFKVIQPVVF